MLARQQAKSIPAPMAFTLFRSVVANFKKVGLPDVYGGKTVPAFIPANLRYRARLSLRSLKLIADDGQVLKSFHELVKAWDTPHWLGALQGLIRNAYPFMADQDLTAMTAAKLHTVFVAHVGKDSTILSKSEMFFLNLAASAGMVLSDSLQKRVEASEARSTTDTAAPKKIVAKNSAKTAALAKDTTAMKHHPKLVPVEQIDKILDVLKLFEGKGMNAVELGAVMTLLKSAQQRAVEGK
jgi:hypothetical protein